MITWVRDTTSGVYIGPLNQEESNEVKKTLGRHGNSFTESSVYLYAPDNISCNYEEFVKQVKDQNG